MTDKAKASREKILLNGESFSYLFFEGSSSQNPILFFHAPGLNAATYLNLLTKIFKDFEKFLSPRLIASNNFERFFLKTKKVVNLFFSLSVN